MSKKYSVLIGLGNPGGRFAGTRHNVGFAILDHLATLCGGKWIDKGTMLIAPITIKEHDVLLIKPQTFMNDSGAIMADVKKRGFTVADILVVHDELEKPFGKIAFKEGGSHRGHNGLRSIIEAVGSDFDRLRVGIGRPTNKDDVPDYVLERFDESPEAVAHMIEDAVHMIQLVY